MAPPCKVDVPPPDVEQRAGSERVLRQEDSKTATHKSGVAVGGVALKNARLNCQSATLDPNCASLKQFQFPPPDVEHRAGSERILRKK